jgi:hypothetical protein
MPGASEADKTKASEDFLCTVGSATAADLARPVYRAPVAVAAPVWSWSGFTLASMAASPAFRRPGQRQAGSAANVRSGLLRRFRHRSGWIPDRSLFRSRRNVSAMTEQTGRLRDADSVPPGRHAAGRIAAGRIAIGAVDGRIESRGGPEPR